MNTSVPARVCVSTLFLFFIGALGAPAKREDCCRYSFAKVLYDSPTYDARYPEESEILDAVRTKDKTILSVRLLTRARENALFQIILSQDAGETWTSGIGPIFSPLPEWGTENLQAPSDARVRYRLLEELGLYLRSQDSGETWQLPKYAVDGEPRDELARRLSGRAGYRLTVGVTAVDPRDPFTLYADVAVVPWGELLSSADLPTYPLPGTYTSKDGGETWTRFTDALRPGIPMAISPANPNLFWGDGPEGVVKSTDGGKHWVAVGEQRELEASPVIRERGAPGGRSVLSSRGLEVQQFVPDPADANTVYIVSNKGTYRSLDGGRSWCLLELGFDVIDSLRNMGVVPSNPLELIVGTIYGVLYSDDRGCRFKKIYPTQASGAATTPR